MQLVHQGKSDEEAVENAIKMLQLGRKKLAVSRHDVYVSSVHYCKKGVFLVCHKSDDKAKNHLNMATDQVISVQYGMMQVIHF